MPAGRYPPCRTSAVADRAGSPRPAGRCCADLPASGAASAGEFSLISVGQERVSCPYRSPCSRPPSANAKGE